MTGLKLWLSGKKIVRLERTLFWSEDGQAIISARTKPSAQLRRLSSFQWTRAVQAFVILLIRYKIIHEKGSYTENQIILAGGEGSAALFLHKAIVMRSNWLVNMLGYDGLNRPYSYQLIQSSALKSGKHGAVAISVDPTVITSGNIYIDLDGREIINNTELCNLLSELEKQWNDFSSIYQFAELEAGDYLISEC